MTPKVSIGIPAYKTAFLEEAMASVMAQTFQDWELIVVDDCSPGDVRGIVERFSDPRIRYYRNEQNLGAEDPSYNWDRCVSYARGEYFCLLCDDDLYHPTFLEEMLKLAEQFPDCHVFRARAEIISREGQIIDKFPSSPLWESCEDYIWHKTKGLRFQTISEWMLHTQHIRDCGGYAHFPCAWGADEYSMFRFSVEGGIASSYKLLVSFRNSGLNISMHPEIHLTPKLEALVLEKEKTIDMIKKNAMDSKLIELVKRKQELDSRYVISCADMATFMKIMLFRRRKYGIRFKSFIIDAMKRIQRLARL